MGVVRAKTGRRTKSGIEQTAADADQTAADADQTSSDSRPDGLGDDVVDAASDQRASDMTRRSPTASTRRAPTPSTRTPHTTLPASERQTVAAERQGTREGASATAHDRDDTASDRDRVADDRDARAETPSEVPPDLSALAEHEALLIRQLEELAAEAAADRARAAADRARAATDRANAARERARLQAELDRAHLDELTGAFRRELGRQALSNEMDRARRSDGRFVLAFVDVDDLKLVNDRDGHAAGDRALQGVV